MKKILQLMDAKTKFFLLCGLLYGCQAAAQADSGGILNSFLEEGTPTGNFRLRLEHADQSGLDAAKALTIRSRVGFLSGKAYGFQALVEMEDIRLLNSRDAVNLAGSNPSGVGKTVIPDPEATELNRAWLAYVFGHAQVKGGRARIKLDDDRFIGNVGWRQNEQTFDAFTLKSRILDDMDLFAGYIWKVHRIFGDANGSPADFSGDSLFINAAHSFSRQFKLVGFAYLLDLENDLSKVPFAGSGDTIGLRATGTIDLTGEVSLSYIASYASQSDNGGSPASGARSEFDLDYYLLQGTLGFGAGSIGIGMEVLEGDGTSIFATPLATVHAFQGWADVFLGNSISGVGLGDGVQDLYLTAGYTVPLGRGVSVKASHHWFEAESDFLYGGKYGKEFNLVAIYPVSKHLKAIAKYAAYNGDSQPNNPRATDVDKFWIELSLSF